MQNPNGVVWLRPGRGPLTSRQAQVQAVIERFWSRHGRAPTTRDLATILEVAPSAAYKAVIALWNAGAVALHETCTAGAILARVRDALTWPRWDIEAVTFDAEVFHATVEAPNAQTATVWAFEDWSGEGLDVALAPAASVKVALCAINPNLGEAAP